MRADRPCHWLLLAMLIIVGSAAAEPLLPDLVPLADADGFPLNDGEFDLTSEPGRVLWRFDVVIANFGVGPFQVYEETDFEARTQDVYQDVFDSGGGFERHYRATFTDVAPSFGHLSFERLADYRLRAVTNDAGVGDVVVADSKTSHAVVDSLAIDRTLPNAPATHKYRSVNANPLGISVGYADLYGRNIPEQRLDITGVEAGTYWLEVEIDPVGNVIESDRTNNTARVLISLPLDEPVTLPGDYNQDGVVNAIDYTVWRDTGISSTTLPNDRTFGTAPDDRGVWEMVYGSTESPTTIPEPIGAMLLFVSLLTVAAARWSS
ncbi:MAG: lysyl oxidase family protein [Planctomycetota bacterium]